MQRRSSTDSKKSDSSPNLKKSNSKSKEEQKSADPIPKTPQKKVKYTTQECKNLQSTSTMTLTFGDVAENHRGMQKIGNLAQSGFSVSELEAGKLKFEAKGCKCELININEALEGTDVEGESAAILIARGGVNYLDSKLTADKLFEEQMNLEWDTKALMYGRVVDKHARSNLCYSETSQEPDYKVGKGRVVAFSEMPMTNTVRQKLDDFMGSKAKNLQAEGNLYYDLKECGIGFHGDTERRIVIALRLGAKMNIQYQWFLEGEPVGKRIELFLNHGDLYVMSEKASGFDWKTKKKATLRHAAGAKKFTTIKEKKKKKEGEKKKKAGEKKKAGDNKKKAGGKRKSKKESSSEGSQNDDGDEEEDEEEEEEKVDILKNSKKITKVKY